MKTLNNDTLSRAEDIKNDFLLSFLKDYLTETCQIMVINEYRERNGDGYIFRNTEDGLESMLESTDKSDIVFAMANGNYDLDHEFVKFDDCLYINSFNGLWDCDSADVDNVIDWLSSVESDERCDAFMVCDEDDVANLDWRFSEVINEFFDYEDDEDIIQEWVEDREINARVIFTNDLADLVDDYIQWRENKDWQEEKELEKCGL